MKKTIYLFIFLLFFAQKTFATVYTKEQIKEALNSINNYNSFVQMTDAYPMFTGTKKKILIRHFQDMYKDGVYIDYIADQFVEAGLNNDQNPIYKNRDMGNVAREFGATLAGSLLPKGLSRLDFEGQKYFINHIALLLSVADDKQCASYLFPERFKQNNAIEESMIEMALLSNLPDEYIEKYFIFSRKAMLAEILDSPMRRVPSKSEIEFSTNAYELKYEELFLKHPNMVGMANYFNNPNSLDYKSACDVGHLGMDALLALEGNMQVWYMQFFIIQMQ